MELGLAAKIESVLFWRGEPEKISRLASLFEKDTKAIEAALLELEQSLLGRGIRLMRTDGEVSLVTSADAASIIEQLRKDELARDLGKAGAETLATILYRGPATKAEIEYVRGVNCASILRSLLIRGLVEKVPSEERKVSFLYKPTADLLAELGVTRVEELPEYENAKKELTDWESKNQNAEE